MSHENEGMYFAQREKAERLAAERAIVPAARHIHNALADQYARNARSLTSEPWENVL